MWHNSENWSIIGYKFMQLAFVFVQNLHRTRVGGLNIDSVRKYFEELRKAVEYVEGMNGHKLLPNEILNLDETGFDLSNCTKTMRIIIKTTKYKRQPKPAHQGQGTCKLKELYLHFWKLACFL